MDMEGWRWAGHGHSPGAHGAPRNWKTQEGPSAQGVEGALPCPTWVSDSRLQNWERRHFCCFKRPRAALGSHSLRKAALAPQPCARGRSSEGLRTLEAPRLRWPWLLARADRAPGPRVFAHGQTHRSTALGSVFFLWVKREPLPLSRPVCTPTLRDKRHRCKHMVSFY